MAAENTPPTCCRWPEGARFNEAAAHGRGKLTTIGVTVPATSQLQ